VTAASVIAIVLAVLLIAALVAITLLTRTLAVTRAELTELREMERTEPAATRYPRTAQAAQAAGLAVRTVVETASRLREQGVRSTLLGSIDEFTSWALEHRGEIARIAAPDGTVTILFSDIESSTSLNSELGDEQWVRLLASHDKLLHTYVEKHRGLIVKSQGDGYMVAFSTPELALASSREVTAPDRICSVARACFMWPSSLTQSYPDAHGEASRSAGLPRSLRRLDDAAEIRACRSGHESVSGDGAGSPLGPTGVRASALS